MPDINKAVFISYRRNVSSYVALSIFLDLRGHKYNVFMDVESIDSGTFDSIILTEIAARPHFLVICTPGTFERCNEDGDWLRREIEYAMDYGRNIVPIMANDFKFEGNRQHLTGKLSQLSRFNGLPLSHDLFSEAMAKLRKRFLKQRVSGSIQPAPPENKSVVEEKIEKTASQPAPTRDELTAEGFFTRAFWRKDIDLDGKIADNTEAIRLNPDYADAYINRGVARDKQGDLNGAMADYDKAIHLSPNDVIAFNNRGFTRFKQGDLSGAIWDLSEAIHLNPNHALAYNNRGLVRDKQGDLSGANENFTKAIQLRPDFAEAYSHRGNTRFAMKNYQNAKSDFGRALMLKPDHPLAAVGMAITLHALGQIKLAQTHWRTLVKRDRHYLEADWVGEELGWRPELVEEARKLIVSL